MTTVGFQGIRGAYSEQAAQTFFGHNIEALPCESFNTLLTTLMQHQCDYVALPIENALAGTVIPALDSLLQQQVSICGEVAIPIEHCLLAASGAHLNDIKQVYSHPQALAQCDQFIRQHHLTAHSFFDTAGAAQVIAKQKDITQGAIASKLAAERYQLDILAENIADKSFNQTRFLILSREAQTASADIYKTTLMLELHHKPNTLTQVLQNLGKYNLNLTTLFSRPNRKTPWQYQFFLEFIFDANQKHNQANALQALAPLCQQLRVLGSYPANIMQ